MRRVSLVLLGCAMLTAGAGCGGSGKHEPTPVTGSFVGTVPGTDAFVAVVAGKENVVAYVCDGRAGVAELFTGARSGRSVDLTSADGARLTATIEQGEAGGKVRLASGRYRFSASPANGRAGFYRVLVKTHGQEVKLGWVVLGDGRQRGAKTTTSVTQAPSLDTASRTTMLAGVGTVSVPLITTGTVTKAFNFNGGSTSFSGKR
jgi:hypothetical protein